MLKKHLLREFARDLIALGGIPFLILTIVRVSMLAPYYPAQFIISSLLFFLLNFYLKGSLHAGIGLVLFIFISLFYHNFTFTIFAAAVYAAMIFSLFYLGKTKREVFRGLLLGAITAGIGYVIVRLVF